MAQLTTNISGGISLRERLSQIVARIVAALDAYAEVKSRSAELDRLMALSDEELAARGMRRDEIPHYVFRDLYYV
ncbi:MAG: hypothetical protein HUJ27_08360 [Rhodobacteraceae bacterium]|nr:hypothetical protein [Paracoccaceae bacterium]